MTDETEERMTYADHAASCPTCDITLCPEGRELLADAVQPEIVDDPDDLEERFETGDLGGGDA
jgi:hypothetical protein